ncbi:hypothetical protein Amir_7067 [Actinosynnema mirum DSM 43827]|uniref:Uncharacterized protein n=1 Tax=Actinosynnema mirum (strain ATCC 29888 / DSM 43827 / JCM 3225 / NBRC 14064 / NCIMB 13271 / NRRL B-12336 / IMRU 3971 / 101) TaxID=446462 RepID=C6WSI8_ACTMD|nr:hypothetical protein Amir_7067 [Actinosynnema mirum DSM 43827]
MEPSEEPKSALVDHAVRSLQALLGSKWEITNEVLDDGAFDARVRLVFPGSKVVEFLVLAERELTPRDINGKIAQTHSILRHAHVWQSLLVVSPWLSPRTQHELREHGVDYLDLTGNVSLNSDDPLVRIHLQGLTKSSSKPSTGRTITLAGSRTGRIVRFLVDHAPPYQAKDVAQTAKVSTAWVSRLLGQLEERLLIQRENRVITKVDWRGLLRARAAAGDLLRDNPHHGGLALNGVRDVLERLRSGAINRPFAITGPHAARALAPLSVGGQLMVYVDASEHEVTGLMDDLGLLPTDESPDVLFLKPQDPVVFEGARVVEGLPHIAPSQLVLDGLAGPGRMPAEAEAVLAWMADHEDEWRR